MDTLKTLLFIPNSITRYKTQLRDKDEATCKFQTL